MSIYSALTHIYASHGHGDHWFTAVTVPGTGDPIQDSLAGWFNP